MPKTIVVCLDGTWNTPEDQTNIHWLHEKALKRDNQLVYYDQGVGTGGWLDDKVGGNLGWGVSQNVAQAYTFIWKHWRAGDDVFVFGFSRGAFTARSLCGFIKLVGKLSSLDDLDDAYKYYRIHEPWEDDNFFEAWLKPQYIEAIPIRFLGVFDTVGALGLPFEISDRATDARETAVWSTLSDRLRSWLDGLGDRLRRPVKGFHDTTLSDVVEEGYHALAIDERRSFFRPTLWTKAPGEALKRGPDGGEFQVRQKAEQVWFAGSHMDVGGGDATGQMETRISSLPLLWMCQKAEAAGMVFEDGFVPRLRDHVHRMALALQHDSMSKRWEETHAKLGTVPMDRPIGNTARRRVNPAGDFYPVIATDESIHHLVAARLDQQIDVRSASPDDGPREPPQEIYRPKNIVREMIARD